MDELGAGDGMWEAVRISLVVLYSSTGCDTMLKRVHLGEEVAPPSLPFNLKLNRS
jgi:hypothetical protein